MKYILLLEIPSSVSMDKRHRINVALKSKSYSKPKRNVYLIEVATEKEIEAIAEFVRRTLVDPRSTVIYYRLAE